VKGPTRRPPPWLTAMLLIGLIAALWLLASLLSPPEAQQAVATASLGPAERRIAEEDFVPVGKIEREGASTTRRRC
jgi:hypothetical protein